MAEKRLDHDFFEMMKHEHQELIDLLGQVRNALDPAAKDPAAKDPDVKDATEVKRLMTDLCDHVRSHFEHEEEGGYLHEVLEHAPRLTNLAEKLLQQHATLSEIAEKLCWHVKTEPSEGTWWKELEEMFDDFSKQLLKHEAQEDGLVQEAFTQDIGTGD